jgi:hypothetical protein
MAYIGVSPSNGVRQKHTYTATASQTTFSGAGAEGVSLSYRDSNYVDVYVNGVKLGDADYTATSGTSIVFDPGLPVNDIVEVIVYDVFSVADTVSKADGGTFDGNVTMAGTLGVTGETTLSTHLNMGDNDIIKLGASADLQIYHDGSNSYISDEGTGHLYLRGTNLRLANTSGSENYLVATDGGSVTINHAGDVKLTTTSTGIDVTGTAVTDGLTVAGNLSVDGGTIKLDGNHPVGSNNVALGNASLDSLITGNNNTAIGYQALTANTTSNLTAVGWKALNSNTTGGSGTAVGYNSLEENTTGSYNTAFGRQALQENTTASANTAMGYTALRDNLTGANNTALGYLALQQNTTGSSNTAIGKDALDSNIEGDGNVAVGVDTLQTNLSGDYNTGTGNGALFRNTTGSTNTAIGYESLRENTTASNNTALGYRALYNNSTGTSNTALGTGSGDNITSGSGNLVSGYDAGRNITTGGNNTYIGSYSGRDNQTASYNTYVGYNCGHLISTGAKNTIIGNYSGNEGDLDIRTSSNNIVLSDGDGNPRLYINSNGDLALGANLSPHNTTNTGVAIYNDGYIFAGKSSDAPIYANRITNDGAVININQNGTTEGSISVSGSTVSYNGGHLARWSRLADDSKDTSIVKGTVMTNLDEMVEWGDEDNEQLNKMAVSSVEGDANVAGVFVNWDNDDDWNDMNIAMTGDMVIRIPQGTTVARGDLLMSAGDGTAKPQGDDIVRSKTIAKVTSTNVSHTYDDGTYLVPCVLMAC